MNRNIKKDNYDNENEALTGGCKGSSYYSRFGFSDYGRKKSEEMKRKAREYSRELDKIE